MIMRPYCSTYAEFTENRISRTHRRWADDNLSGRRECGNDGDHHEHEHHNVHVLSDQ